MKYALQTVRSFDKSFQKLSSVAQTHIQNLVFQLEDNPRLGKPLKGYQNFLWSLHTRVSKTDYRIVYTIDEKAQAVVLFYVASRENFYTEVKRLKLKIGL